ncbi:hypothetical protein [Comamonas thiooxydans]|uniref:hypothetical protein n=1 Tax=Comamonas thiooxydans TaxID=363952 RepID=UPI000B412422|nr:hypothetical protein [Comamonas thiooxydans]
MAIDFDKLNDPIWQAEQKRLREAEQQKLEAEDKVLKELVNKCIDHTEELTERERNFVRSCQTRLNSWLALSDAQKSWLNDIGARFN